MWKAFKTAYLPERSAYELRGHELVSDTGSENTHITAQLVVSGTPQAVTGTGNGPIAAFVDALRNGLAASIDVVDYAEHAVGQGADATAVSADGLHVGDGGGVGALPERVLGIVDDVELGRASCRERV